MESGETVFEAFKKLNIKDAIVTLKLAQDATKHETIHNCFKHAKWLNINDDEDFKVECPIENYKKFLAFSNIIDSIKEKGFNKIGFKEMV